MDDESKVAWETHTRLMHEMQSISDRLADMARVAAEHGLCDEETHIGAVGVHAANVADLMGYVERLDHGSFSG